jgi:hypothetical protein
MRADHLSAATLFLANQSLTGNVARVRVVTPNGTFEGALARVSLGGSSSLAFVGPSGMAGFGGVEVDLSNASAMTVFLSDGSQRAFG